MKFRTQLIQFSSDPDIHFVVGSNHTSCGMSLQDKQRILHYDLAGHKICPKCQQKSIPRLKKWNRERRITSAHYARETLHMLYLFHELLGEELGIYWGLHEFNQFGCNDLTNYLMNDQPNIEGVDEERQEISISYREGESRQNRTVTFEKLAQFHNLIKGNVFEVLQGPRFLN